jgi:hypothetical protein
MVNEKLQYNQGIGAYQNQKYQNQKENQKEGFETYGFLASLPDVQEKEISNKKEEETVKGSDLKVKIEVNNLSFYYGKEKFSRI